MELDKLSIGKISDITNSNAEEFSRKVKELDPTVDDLKALKEAEENGQNREELLTFLDNQLTSKNVSNYLGIAEQSIDNLDGLIRQIEDVEDIHHFEEKNIEIEQDDLIDLVGGTVQEMKDFVNEKKLTEKQLQNILDAEKRVKNRKTAKKFLRKSIRRQEIGKDVEDAREDLDSLEDDIEEIKDDEDREIELEDPEKDVENEEDGEKDTDRDEKEEENDETEDEEDIEEDTSGPEEEKNTEEDEVDEELEEGFGDDEEVESDDDSKDKFEDKKELVDDLDLDLSDEELEEVSLKQLKDIRDEKEHREELIDRLKGEGMDEEDLRDSSTSDLEKVVEGLDSSSEESQEEHEEMREEAEEDLEMLMGAVKDEEEEEEDSGKDAREKFEDFTESIREKLHRSNEEGEEESSSGINAKNVQEVLDQYRELDAEEASVKTAHIMKGYLEQRLGIEREMTYKELADKMPVEEDESMDELADFFVKMHREQYTGTFNIEEADEIIDTCDRVIEKLG